MECPRCCALVIEGRRSCPQCGALIQFSAPAETKLREETLRGVPPQRDSQSTSHGELGKVDRFIVRPSISEDDLEILVEQRNQRIKPLTLVGMTARIVKQVETWPRGTEKETIAAVEPFYRLVLIGKSGHEKPSVIQKTKPLNHRKILAAHPIIVRHVSELRQIARSIGLTEMATESSEPWWSFHYYDANVRS